MRYPGPVARFRRDSVSWSVWPRLAISVPVVAFGAVLVRSLAITAFEGEPEAALLLFIVGVYLFYAIPLVRVLWVPSASWRNEQVRAQAETRRIEDRHRRQSDGSDVPGRIAEFGADESRRT